MPRYEAYTCAETFRRLDDYLDRELAAEELERVREHLVTCAVCAHEFRYEEHVIREVRGKLQRIAVPPDLYARVWRTVTKARLESADPPEPTDG